jgi:RNA-binding protein
MGTNKDYKEYILQELKGYQKKYLRGLAHKLRPVVYVGQKGATDAVVDSLEEALSTHELVKIKFVENKEKNTKKMISTELEKRTGSRLVGLIGHVVILFRSHPDPDKRKIILPRR